MIYPVDSVIHFLNNQGSDINLCTAGARVHTLCWCVSLIQQCQPRVLVVSASFLENLFATSTADSALSLDLACLGDDVTGLNFHSPGNSVNSPA